MLEMSQMAKAMILSYDNLRWCSVLDSLYSRDGILYHSNWKGSKRIIDFMLYEGEGGRGNGEDKIFSFIQFPV